MNWLKIEFGRGFLRFFMTFFELMTIQMLNMRQKSKVWKIPHFFKPPLLDPINWHIFMHGTLKVNIFWANNPWFISFGQLVQVWSKLILATFNQCLSKLMPISISGNFVTDAMVWAYNQVDRSKLLASTNWNTGLWNPTNLKSIICNMDIEKGCNVKFRHKFDTIDWKLFFINI